MVKKFISNFFKNFKNISTPFIFYFKDIYVILNIFIKKLFDCLIKLIEPFEFSN